MGPDRSLLCSQKHTTRICPQPIQSSSHRCKLISSKPSLKTSSHLHLGLPCDHFTFHPRVFRILPISALRDIYCALFCTKMFFSEYHQLTRIKQHHGNTKYLATNLPSCGIRNKHSWVNIMSVNPWKVHEILCSHGVKYENDCLLRCVPFSLVETDWHFRSAYCLWWATAWCSRQYAPLKCQSIFMRLHGTSSQKAVTFLKCSFNLLSNSQWTTRTLKLFIK
jgi:hypothetical protein